MRPSHPLHTLTETRGRVLLRFRDDAGTIASEVHDPPRTLSKLLAMVRFDNEGQLSAQVEGGRARIRCIDFTRDVRG